MGIGGLLSGWPADTFAAESEGYQCLTRLAYQAGQQPLLGRLSCGSSPESVLRQQVRQSLTQGVYLAGDLGTLSSAGGASQLKDGCRGHDFPAVQFDLSLQLVKFSDEVRGEVKDGVHGRT